MIARYNQLSLALGVLGLVLLSIGGYFNLPPVSIVGLIFFIYGIVYYVVAKGRSPSWTIMGLFGPSGLTALSGLEDRGVEPKPKSKSCMLDGGGLVSLPDPAPPFEIAHIKRSYCPSCDVAFVEVSGNFINVESVIQLRRREGELTLNERDLSGVIISLGIDWKAEEQKIRIHVKHWHEQRKGG